MGIEKHTTEDSAVVRCLPGSVVETGHAGPGLWKLVRASDRPQGWYTVFMIYRTYICILKCIEVPLQGTHQGGIESGILKSRGFESRGRRPNQRHRGTSKIALGLGCHRGLDMDGGGAGRGRNHRVGTDIVSTVQGPG